MRGFWYIIESVLAGIVIFGFLAVLGRIYVVPVQTAELGMIGYESLKSLDDQNLLRDYVVNGNYSGLDSLISLVNYSHSIKICNQSGSCSGPDTGAANVWTAVYLIAGNQTYDPYEVRVFLWK